MPLLPLHAPTPPPHQLLEYIPIPITREPLSLSGVSNTRRYNKSLGNAGIQIWLNAFNARFKVPPGVTVYPVLSHIVPFVLDHLNPGTRDARLAWRRCDMAERRMFLHGRVHVANPVGDGKTVDRWRGCLTCETLTVRGHGTEWGREHGRFAHGRGGEEFVPTQGHAAQVKVT